MNKTLLITTIGSLLLIIGSVTYVVISSRKDKNVDTPTTQTQSTTSNTQTVQETPAQKGQYIAYSDEAVANTKGTKLLFFHAPWCSQCRQIEASITADGVPDGVTVLKIDYDSNQELRQKYGVTLQTTFVKIDDDGNKIDSYVAYEEPRFGSVERELLND